MNTHNANGTLSAYGLACGYQDVEEVNGYMVRLWREHGAYHVRVTDVSGRAWNQRIRLAWHSFRTLTGARRNYRAALRTLRDYPDMVEYHLRNGDPVDAMFAPDGTPSHV